MGPSGFHSFLRGARRRLRQYSPPGGTAAVHVLPNVDDEGGAAATHTLPSGRDEESARDPAGLESRSSCARAASVWRYRVRGHVGGPHGPDVPGCLWPQLWGRYRGNSGSQRYFSSLCSGSRPLVVSNLLGMVERALVLSLTHLLCPPCHAGNWGSPISSSGRTGLRAFPFCFFAALYNDGTTSYFVCAQCVGAISFHGELV